MIRLRVFRKLCQEEHKHLTFNAFRNTKHKKRNTLRFIALAIYCIHSALYNGTVFAVGLSQPLFQFNTLQQEQHFFCKN